MGDDSPGRMGLVTQECHIVEPGASADLAGQFGPAPFPRHAGKKTGLLRQARSRNRNSSDRGTANADARCSIYSRQTFREDPRRLQHRDPAGSFSGAAVGAATRWR
jgi:hypothetical protein